MFRTSHTLALDVSYKKDAFDIQQRPSPVFNYMIRVSICHMNAD